MATEVRYAHGDHRCILKLTGEIRHTMSSVVDAIIAEFLADEESREYVIDLTDATFIDSTNLGLLAKIAREAWRRGHAKPVIVSRNPEINAVIDSMGFDTAFRIVAEHEATRAELHKAPTPPKSEDADKGRRMLEAHEALIDLDERNRKAFQQVVDVLRKDAGKND
jgi:anti-anti-sigma factor